MARPHLLSPQEEDEMKHELIDALDFEKCQTPQQVAEYLGFGSGPYKKMTLRHVTYYMKMFGLSFDNPHQFADAPEHIEFLKKLNEPLPGGYIDVENINLAEYGKDPRQYEHAHPELFGIKPISRVV